MFEQKKFKFSADSKTLEATIKNASNVLSVAASESDNLYFLCGSKGELKLYAINKGAFVVLTVPNATSDSDGAFGFNVSDLIGLIKNRSIMNFIADTNECKFKAAKSSYEGRILTLPITEDQKVHVGAMETKADKSIKGVVVTPELFASIKAALQCAQVKDVYQNATLLSLIEVKNSLLTISSFARQHFALITHPVDSKANFRVAVPALHWNLLDQIVGQEHAKFYMGDKIRAEGKTFTLVLPAAQAAEADFGKVASLVASLGKAEFKAKLDLKELQTVSANLTTLYNGNSHFVFDSTDGKKLKVSYNTTTGSASDAVDVVTKGKAKFGIDPRLLNDLLPLSSTIEAPVLDLYKSVATFSGKVGDGNLILGCGRSE